MDSTFKDKIIEKLVFLYGNTNYDVEEIYKQIEEIINKYSGKGKSDNSWVSEEDVMLITYGDSIREEGKPSLQTMKEFLVEYVDSVNAVHFLPFFPYTSDDGFSVVDFREIDPELGSWDDVNEIADQYELMFDAVINHMSKESDWFKGYLNNDPKYEDYFVEADPNLDYSQVTRPRALPLLTSFDTEIGTKYMWTTFSDDQIDINYKNPEVLLEIIDILNMYAKNGAKYLRLDAIGFMWKELGTSCIHLDETHALIKLMRDVLEVSAPGTILITETNVPHEDNISYFGNGYDEAHMVYQFPLPPLTLFSFLKGNAKKLTDWAASLEPTTTETSYFNFLASHDGVGLRPTEGVLTDDERQFLVDTTTEHGGLVSYRDNGDGTKSPYELNINYLNALVHPDQSDDVKVKRFLAAHSILLSIVGVPGVYVHSLLGSENYYEGVEESNINRRINREKLNKDQLVKDLNDDTLRAKVFNELSNLIKLRRTQKAFHPNAKQEVLFLDDRVFSIIRENEETGDTILVLVNVSNDIVHLSTAYTGKDLIHDIHIDGDIELAPNQFMWII